MKEKKSLSVIFNRELRVGEPVIYTQIISSLSNLGVTDDLSQITQDNVREMAKRIYDADPDCCSSAAIHASLFSFFREYKAKIIRDISLYTDNINVKFNVKLRQR